MATLKDGYVLVTGGVSGLGEATSRLFVSLGRKVLALDMNAERGAEFEKELAPNVLFQKCDVASEKDVEAALDAADAKFG